MDVYTELPALQHGQIRLLKIHPRSELSEAAVEITLSTHSIDNPPDFAALSYTWGPPHYNIQELRRVPSDEINKVICNGQPVNVASNLHDFLLHSAASQDPELQDYIWIDALAINQHNLPERSHQVNIMGTIYAAASRVIVWLGPSDSSTPSAFTLMHGLIALSPAERVSLHPHDVRTSHPNPLLSLENWLALSRFFRRTWFNRAWIIQEVVFARAVRVLCGSHSISWADLSATSHLLATTSWTSFLKDPGHFGDSESTRGQWHNTPASLAAAKKTWEVGSNEGLLYALIRARSSSSQDPRDKVYSQLGLGRADIFPDYKLSVKEVYVEAAKYILEHSQSLLLLTCVEGEEFQTIPGLPSWVPDWSVSEFLGLRITGYRQFKAASTLAPAYTLSQDGDKHILTVKAVKVDDIVEVGDVKGDLRQNLSSSNLWAMLSQLKILYTDPLGAEDAVWRSLMTNRESVPPNNQVLYPASPDRLRPSFRAWILWRYAMADTEPQMFPQLTVPDSILPNQDEILEARTKAAADPVYAKSLAHSASVFDLHYSHSKHQRPYRTEKGYFGIGTQCLHRGDSVWLVPGCRVPLILRSIEGSSRYRLVGGSYLHGIMDGEVINRTDIRFEQVGIE